VLATISPELAAHPRFEYARSVLMIQVAKKYAHFKSSRTGPRVLTGRE